MTNQKSKDFLVNIYETKKNETKNKIFLLCCMMSKWYNNASLYRRKKLVFVRGWE